MIGRHKLTIQAKRRLSDGEGGFIVDWADLREVWATVKPLNSMEMVKYQKLNDEISHLVTMRYDPTINTSFRFKFNNRILKITGRPINIDEMNRELEITCIESFNQS